MQASGQSPEVQTGRPHHTLTLGVLTFAGTAFAGFGLLSAVFGVGGGFGIVLSGVIVDHARE